LGAHAIVGGDGMHRKSLRRYDLLHPFVLSLSKHGWPQALR